MPAGVDIGSSSVKAVLVSPQGAILRTARRRITTRRAPGGHVEHDGEEIFAASLAALGAAGLGRLRDEPLGIATQRSTLLFWDPHTGRPLTPAYSWQDLRGEAMCAALRRAGDLEARITATTGLRLTAYYSASKLAWALRHVRGLRRRVQSGRALWGTLGTFLLWRLSQGASYAVDHANAQRTLLLDLGTLSWDPELFTTFGLDDLLDAPALPALLPTTLGTPVGMADGAANSAPLRAMTGDQQAALVGLGCRQAGGVSINYGSGAFVLVATGDRPLRLPGLLTTLLASWGGQKAGRGTASRYAVEGPVNAAATAIDWAAHKLRLALKSRDLDRFLGPDDGRPRTVHFLPAVAGLGAPRWDAVAKPFFAGDSRGASPRALMRAVVESIAYRCAEIVRAVPEAVAGGSVPGVPIFVAGGLTRCKALLQAQADLLQRPVMIRESPDATGLGAALLTRPPARWWDRTTENIVRGDGTIVVEPRLSMDEAETRYRDWEKAVYRPEALPGPGVADVRAGSAR